MIGSSVLNIDNKLQDSIIGTIGYYSLFNYPVTTEEILGSLPQKCSFVLLRDILEELVHSNRIYCYEGYYYSKENVKELTVKRQKANILALAKLPGAAIIGSFIYKFPFVRFVGISGSLSKGYADEKSDFDFFIVAENNRLWICRTLLHLFKKLTFLVGVQNKFCMNYFVDSSKMELEEKNRYTAIELASLIPVAGAGASGKLFKANQWINTYLPNGYKSFYDVVTINDHNNWLKNIMESFFNILSPEKLNNRLMQFTDTRWRKKWAKKKFPMDEYEIAFKTTLHISKNHPSNYQKIVLEAISKFEIGKDTH